MTFNTSPSYPRLRSLSSAIAILATVACAACQPAASKPTPSASLSISATPLRACPLGSRPSNPQVLASGQPAPDDLAFDNVGRLLFSDVNTGSVSLLQPDGSIQRIAGGLSEPEGIVVQADGRILVAEQGKNRIVAIDPQTHAVTTWRDFVNRTSHPGIDGIGPILPSRDANGQALPNGGDVLVPDSPNGVLWAVGPDGKTATRLTSGMSRPVGAAVDGAGHILVTDEGGALWILDPSRRRLATLPTPDDVVVSSDGHIFVTTLGDNGIHELDSQGRQLGVTSGIVQPQGLALDAADNLYYTAFNGGQVARVVRTYVLGRPTVHRIATNRYVVCPLVQRAPGYTGPLSLVTESRIHIDVRAEVQPGTDSSGALEIETEAPSITISIGRLSQTVALNS
ncbi:MAG TPA: hypothetical protein VIT43_09765 [Candidatus Dormibacteraeota bacterium]